MRIAALCVLAAAKHAGALLIEGCADEEGFVDPWGYECADWARSGVRSSRAHLAGSFPQVGYSCYYYDDDANAELLVAGCPMTCGACECVDAEDYEDPWGYACADWVGYSCYYYSDDEKTEELVANCPASCSLCAAEEAARFPGATFVLTLPVLYDVRGKLFPNNKYATMATEDMVDAVYGNSSDGSGVYGGVARALRAFDDLKADASKAVLPLFLGAVSQPHGRADGRADGDADRRANGRAHGDAHHRDAHGIAHRGAHALADRGSHDQPDGRPHSGAQRGAHALPERSSHLMAAKLLQLAVIPLSSPARSNVRSKRMLRNWVLGAADECERQGGAGSRRARGRRPGGREPPWPKATCDLRCVRSINKSAPETRAHEGTPPPQPAPDLAPTSPEAFTTS